jgi:hypothetical protein
MIKTSAQEALYKLAIAPSAIRGIRDTVGKRYARYGVNPMADDVLDDLFKGDWQKIHGTPSAQEVFQNSPWMREANAAKAGFGNKVPAPSVSTATTRAPAASAAGAVKSPSAWSRMFKGPFYKNPLFWGGTALGLGALGGILGATTRSKQRTIDRGRQAAAGF